MTAATSATVHLLPSFPSTFSAFLAPFLFWFDSAVNARVPPRSAQKLSPFVVPPQVVLAFLFFYCSSLFAFFVSSRGVRLAAVLAVNCVAGAVIEVRRAARFYCFGCFVVQLHGSRIRPAAQVCARSLPTGAPVDMRWRALPTRSGRRDPNVARRRHEEARADCGGA